jgi:predicted nuclease of restriction endonuclease-like (RecB) superfamily
MATRKVTPRKVPRKVRSSKAAKSDARHSPSRPSDRRDTRHALGRVRGDGEALFPVPPSKSELPTGYAEALRKLKEVIQQTRLRTVIAASTAMLRLYWEVGRTILDRQARQGWGAKVIDRLSHDLRESFPDMAGLSPRNLKYMRAFAAAWPEREFVQAPLAQLSWYQHLALLEKLDEPATRIWYAQQALTHGWSRDVLAHHIGTRLHARQGKLVSNFAATLPPATSDMAARAFKDPYLFDFLGTADPRREREVEQALIEHIERFLIELGAGFAFVGRQIALEVGDQDFKLDLLFYHLKLRCFVVVELKAVDFDPGFVGQLNLYLSAVDDLMKHEDDQPTIGLLLCKNKNKLVVEYALRHLTRPVGVAAWETELVEKLPKELEGSLPTIEQIEAEFSPKPRRR